MMRLLRADSVIHVALNSFKTDSSSFLTKKLKSSCIQVMQTELHKVWSTAQEKVKMYIL